MLKSTNKPYIKNKKYLISSIAFVALLGLAYTVWYENKISQIKSNNIDTLSYSNKNALDSLKSNFHFTEHKLDSIFSVNNSLQGEKLSLNDSFLLVRNEINSIFSNSDISEENINRIQTLISNLYNYAFQLETELNSLRGVDNIKLQKDNQKIVQRKTVAKPEVSKNKLITSENKKPNYENKILYAIEYFTANALKINADGTEKITQIAKNTDKLSLTCKIKKLENDFNSSSDLYIIILDGNNELIKDAHQKIGAFETNQEGTKIYTKKISLQNDILLQDIELVIEPENKLTKGDYKILIYNNGFKIGDYSKKLKKRSLI
ncbi:MAG: hypothetical protein E6Q95_04695 [Chitinophagaceae bacterium]|nr:MAG: hypothetical protein E6Q95_04695 [Chitinophagaceae bacterium]